MGWFTGKKKIFFLIDCTVELHIVKGFQKCLWCAFMYITQLFSSTCCNPGSKRKQLQTCLMFYQNEQQIDRQIVLPQYPRCERRRFHYRAVWCCGGGVNCEKQQTTRYVVKAESSEASSEVRRQGKEHVQSRKVNKVQKVEMKLGRLETWQIHASFMN